MKTEWTQEPHVTVRWALFEALRASDKASTVDYWDVVTENLIQGLGLQRQRAVEYPTGSDVMPMAIRGVDERPFNPELGEHEVDRLASEWKRVDSNA